MVYQMRMTMTMDGIIEGSPAIGSFQRIGLWISATGDASSVFAGSVIGEPAGAIRVDGNNARGVQIDHALTGNFDFSTGVFNGSIGGILGDNSVGVEINENIGGYYRQRGRIDVRGENVVGIDINDAIDGSLMIEAGVNATGIQRFPEEAQEVRSGVEPIMPMMNLMNSVTVKELPTLKNDVKAALPLKYPR